MTMFMVTLNVKEPEGEWLVQKASKLRKRISEVVEDLIREEIERERNQGFES